jgi:hypothetical protein
MRCISIVRSLYLRNNNYYYYYYYYYYYSHVTNKSQRTAK